MNFEEWFDSEFATNRCICSHPGAAVPCHWCTDGVRDDYEEWCDEVYIQPEYNNTRNTKMKLNRKNFAEFFRTDYYTVSVVFLENTATSRPGGAKAYTYKVPKSLKVDVGDKLVVCTQEPLMADSLKVVKVISVNVDAEIEEDSPFQYKWIVGTFAEVMTNYQENLDKDNRLKKAVHKLEQALERVSLRKQLETALSEIGDEERKELSALFGTDLLGQTKPELTNGNS